MPDLTTRTGWRDATAPQKRTFWTRARPWLQRQAADRLAVVLALALAVPAIYWPSAVALNGYWTDTVDHTYTHGYLVLLTSLWLILRDRRRLAAAPVRPMPQALLVVVALSIAWLWLWRAAIQDGHLLLLPALLFAAIAAALGRRAARVLLFPIAFLYFAMPVWSDLNGLLQLMSYKVAGTLLWLTGIPAYLQGDLIRLPAGTLEVAEGCSGLHFFIVGLTLATLYGELSADPWRRRALWCAILGGIALAANWIRIYVIAVVGYTSDMQSSLVPHHYLFGWAVFIAGFLAFLWLAGRLADGWDGKAGDHSEPGTTAASPAVEETRAGFAATVVTLLCLAVLPGLSYGMDLMQGSSGTIAIDWPAAPAGWRGPLPVVWSEWAPAYQNASAQGHRRYVSADGRTVEVFAVAYRTQRQDAKLLGYFNSFLGSEGRLRTLSEETVTAASGVWRQTTTIDAAGTRSLIWARYRIGDRTFADPRLSQLWYGIAALTSRPVSSLTALRAACTPDCAAARSQLAAATTGIEPALRPREGETGGSAP